MLRFVHFGIPNTASHNKINAEYKGHIASLTSLQIQFHKRINFISIQILLVAERILAFREHHSNKDS